MIYIIKIAFKKQENWKKTWVIYVNIYEKTQQKMLAFNFIHDLWRELQNFNKWEKKMHFRPWTGV